MSAPVFRIDPDGAKGWALIEVREDTGDWFVGTYRWRWQAKRHARRELRQYADRLAADMASARRMETIPPIYVRIEDRE